MPPPSAFWANENLQRGQPALLYRVPAVVGSAVFTAWRRARGELEELWRFETAVTKDRIPLDLAMLSEEERKPQPVEMNGFVIRFQAHDGCAKKYM